MGFLLMVCPFRYICMRKTCFVWFPFSQLCGSRGKANLFFLCFIVLDNKDIVSGTEDTPPMLYDGLGNDAERKNMGYNMLK
jgi:hypothetical protein